MRDFTVPEYQLVQKYSLAEQQAGLTLNDAWHKIVGVNYISDV